MATTSQTVSVKHNYTAVYALRIIWHTHYLTYSLKNNIGTQ